MLKVVNAKLEKYNELILRVVTATGAVNGHRNVLKRLQALDEENAHARRRRENSSNTNNAGSNGQENATNKGDNNDVNGHNDRGNQGSVIQKANVPSGPPLPETAKERARRERDEKSLQDDIRALKRSIDNHRLTLKVAQHTLVAHDLENEDQLLHDLRVLRDLSKCLIAEMEMEDTPFCNLGLDVTPYICEHSFIRSIVAGCTDNIKEIHMRQYYRWAMEVPHIDVFFV